MVKLVICGEDFEQEVKPLVKSFYPEEILLCSKGMEKEELQKTAVDEDVLFMELLPFEFELIFLKNNQIQAREKEKFSNLQGQPERKTYRDALCRAIYRILSEVNSSDIDVSQLNSSDTDVPLLRKKELPWGTLIGIRPVKQVLERMEAGEDIEKIRSFMKERYYCSDEKIDLCMSVAAKEKQILDNIDYKSGYSIYIGIPFCPTTCSYCSFTSYPFAQFKHLAEDYLKALEKEIRFISGVFGHKRLNTIYVGGGTPTTLSPKELSCLNDAIHKYLRVGETAEFTVEAGRPDSITKEKLRVLKEAGVNRISINPQSMRQETLNLIGRGHTTAQTEEAFHLARDMGFSNINMDMIIGLTGEVPEDVSYTLDKIRHLNPDSLTVHTLALKRAARLTIERELYEGMKAKDVAEMLRLTGTFAKKEGYEPYYLYRQKNMEENLENIGYARGGKEGIYNVLIMEEKQSILALGAGGSSKFVFLKDNRIERVENVKSLTDYISRIDEMIERKSRFLDMHDKEL